MTTRYLVLKCNLREQRVRAMVLQICRTDPIARLLMSGRMLDWNDLRYFLAVASEGSTLAAGRKLRVSQTTVARRIAALENSLGFPVFEKRQAGYALTPAGEGLVERARQVDRAATSFVEAAAAEKRDTSGTVRITTQEIFMMLLAPMLRELHERHPEIMIELDDSQDFRDLGDGDDVGHPFRPGDCRAALRRCRRRARPHSMHPAARRPWQVDVAGDPRARPPQSKGSCGNRLSLRAHQPSHATARGEKGSRLILCIMRFGPLAQLFIVDQRRLRTERNWTAAAERPFSPIAVGRPDVAIDVEAAFMVRPVGS